MHIDPGEVTIRKAALFDVEAITDIYNDEIQHGVATFDTEPKTVENRTQWLLQHDEKHPVLIAEFNGEVAAWASLTRWSDRCAYDGTAEVSIYVHRYYRGRGIGSILFKELVKQGEALGLHYLLSRITEGNDTSINLHEHNGFRHVGIMHQVGFKFNRWLDVTMMEKVFYIDPNEKV